MREPHIYLNPPPNSTIFNKRMQVHVQETAVVPPSKPPFDGDQILSLSKLDLDRNNNVTLRYLRVYANNHHRQPPPDPFQVITAALSAALVPYYPFAGKLRRRAEDGLLELHCHLGDGVPVVSAVVDCQLSSVDYLDPESENEFTEQLVPNPNPNEDVIQPMILQVTNLYKLLNSLRSPDWIYENCR